MKINYSVTRILLIIILLLSSEALEAKPKNVPPARDNLTFGLQKDRMRSSNKLSDQLRALLRTTPPNSKPERQREGGSGMATGRRIHEPLVRSKR
jgi:hypothetical protein